MVGKTVQEAGAIPFRIVHGKPRILLVRAKRPPHGWIFPKGHIERGEDPSETATRELAEEGGVRGTSLGYVGDTEYDDRDTHYRVKYYLVHFKGNPRGGEKRPRAEFSTDEALGTLEYDEAKRLLRAALLAIEAYRADKTAT